VAGQVKGSKGDRYQASGNRQQATGYRHASTYDKNEAKRYSIPKHIYARSYYVLEQPTNKQPNNYVLLRLYSIFKYALQKKGKHNSAIYKTRKQPKKQNKTKRKVFKQI